ncbi:MAG: DnaB-like helicase C-terminal domain-containing protein, partial [Desulfatiglandales bacterium]|nr:DnaB-like helicase C-terminal domain-containing protein [Desulfatiglandales bacterium]
VLFPPKEGNFTESMTRFMVSLTETAKATNSHILVLSQLNRESSREGRKPRLTDLKGSGGIEENTSLAMFLSRELDSSEAELSILKARSGRSGWSIPMIFNPEKIMFGELYN